MNPEVQNFHNLLGIEGGSMWHWKELFSFGFAVKYELTCVDVIIFSPPPSSLYKRHLFNGLAPSL